MGEKKGSRNIVIILLTVLMYHSQAILLKIQQTMIQIMILTAMTMMMWIITMILNTYCRIVILESLQSQI